MSWMQKLCETYDRCADQVGVVQAGRVPLLPAYHTTQLAQIELVLDTEGNICPGRSSVIEGKGEQTTIIPCINVLLILLSDAPPQAASFPPLCGCLPF